MSDKETVTIPRKLLYEIIDAMKNVEQKLVEMSK